MQIGDRIKARRESLGDFSQEKLAKMLGYSGRSTINKIELNKSRVSQDMVEKFAWALKTSPAYLMGWVDDPELTHEQTIELGRQGKLNPQLLAADTTSTDGSPILIHAEQINKTQQHRNVLADKIRNSDYTDEELDKIEQMLNVIAPR